MSLVAENVIMKSNQYILSLIRKDLLLETRQQYTLYGILLYIASTIFVIYLSMGQPEETVWNGLFWVIQLFVCVNAVAKSFLQESKGRMLYFYSIASAKDFVLAKLDAGDQSYFETVDQGQVLDLGKIIQGIADFRSSFKGKIFRQSIPGHAP